MRSLAWLVPLTLVAVACSAADGTTASSTADDSTAAAPTEPKAGTRLTPMGYRLDGTAVLTHWADATTGQPCTMHYSSGSWTAPGADAYCVPILNAVDVFLDAGCTQSGAVVISGDSHDPRKFAMTSLTTPVTLGTKHAGATVYSRQRDGTCHVETAWTLYAAETYEATPGALSTFAHGTISAIGGDATFTRMRWTGDDGSTGDTGLYTEARTGALCGPRLLGDGGFRCLPIISRSEDPIEFADATCTQPVTDVATGNAAAKTITSSDRCAPVFHDVGTPLTSIYRRAGNECSLESTDSTMFTYATVGAQIPTSSFPTFTAKRGPSAGVTSAQLTATSGGAGTTVLHDAATGEPCYPNRTVSGAMTCTPVDATFAYGYHADAGCTTPVVEADSCQTKTAITWNGLDVASMWKVTTVHQGAVYWKDALTGSCTVMANPPTQPVFDVVATSFPTLAEPAAIVPVVVTPPPAPTTPPAPPAPTYTSPKPPKPAPVTPAPTNGGTSSGANSPSESGVKTTPSTPTENEPAPESAPAAAPAPKVATTSCAMTHGGPSRDGAGIFALVVALAALVSRRRRS